MQQPRRQDGTGRTDRVAVGNRAAFDVDDVFGELELAQASQRDRGERLVDFYTLNVRGLPARTLQCEAHGGNGPDAEHSGFDRSDTMRDEPREWLETAFFRERPLSHDHRRGTAVQARRIAGRDRAVLAKRGFQLGERLDRRLGPIGFILVEAYCPFATGQFESNDLILESSR